jgi:energy-coupling factor transporter ATP-binding protein EcfA2
LITSITIENFKGFREQVQLELRPITLLFGPNSAGKSTILQALHYAYEVFERRNVNPDRTIYGGSAVDLGGFQSLVHGHDRSRQIGISVCLNVTIADLDNLAFRGIAEWGSFLEDFCSGLHEVEIKFVVGWPMTSETPVVLRYEISMDGQFLALISKEVGRPEAILRFDSHHPVFLSVHEAKKDSYHPFDCHPLSAEELEGEETFLGALWQWFSHEKWIDGTISAEEGRIFEVYLDQRHGAFPDPESTLPFQTSAGSSVAETNGPYEEDEIAVRSVISLLTHLIVGPAQIAKSELAKFRYLGPVREIPSRAYAPPRFPDDSRWASGLGAWDALHTGSDRFVDRVAGWLGDPDNLNAGCRVERRNYLELDLADPVLKKLIDGRAFDEVEDDEAFDLTSVPRTSRVVLVPNGSDIELKASDVGVGISQVIPVIVTALDGEGRLLAIEQPELHIHPRLQAEIADLFIEASRTNKHRFLLETHSEHLILRLLRRIRETEKGTVPAGRQLRTDDLAVYYIRQEDGCSMIRRIDVDVKGEFIQPWPDDFFEIDFYERFS